jgi:hypothetical protein
LEQLFLRALPLRLRLRLYSRSPSRAKVAPKAKKPKKEQQKGEMAERPPIALNTGWSFMERGIHKLKRILENENEAQFTAQHYMNLYT